MFRRALVLMSMLLIAAANLQAQRLVSRIEVRGAVPSRIVLSQTTLAEGRTYGDDDLEVAMARLRRLPFVLDARYAFEGETLVIEVDAMRRLFGQLDAAGTGYDGDEHGSAAFSGGGRHLFDSGGVVEGTITEFVTEGDDGMAVDAQYAHYGIGGTRLYAAAGVSRSVRNEEGFEPDPTWRLLLGYPLTIRQSVEATFFDAGFEARRTLPGAPRSSLSFGDSTQIALRWKWDTSDDPFFARQGLTISAGPTWSDDSSQYEGFIIGYPAGDVRYSRFRTDSSSTALSAGVKKFLPIGARGTVIGALGASWTRSEHETSEIGIPGAQPFDSESSQADVTLGYGYNFFDRGPARSLRHRLELGATYSRLEFDRPFGDVTVDGTMLNAAWVLRHQFGTARLNLSYVFDDGAPVAQVPPSDPFPR